MSQLLYIKRDKIYWGFTFPTQLYTSIFIETSVKLMKDTDFQVFSIAMGFNNLYMVRKGLGTTMACFCS